MSLPATPHQPMADLFAESSVRFVIRALGGMGAQARDVEDLAQEVFVIAHRRADQFDATRRAEPWLYGIARNVLRDHRRRASQREHASGDAVEVSNQGRHDFATGPTDADVQLLRLALARLDEPLQDVLLLCDLGGLTVLETCAALGVPEGTLKDRLRKARRLLREAIDQLEREVAHV